MAKCKICSAKVKERKGHHSDFCEKCIQNAYQDVMKLSTNSMLHKCMTLVLNEKINSNGVEKTRRTHISNAQK